jgi:hypothetical protein
VRYFAVVSQLSSSMTEIMKSWPLQRGEVHCSSPDSVDQVRSALTAADLASLVTVNLSRQVGYVLHEKAHELVSMS